MNIYMGNLPYSVRDDELRKTFEEFGEVKSAEVIVDRRSNRSRGYGFVQMGDEAAANAAISGLNGSELQGRTLRVDRSRPKIRKQSKGPRPKAPTTVTVSCQFAIEGTKRRRHYGVRQTSLRLTLLE